MKMVKGEVVLTKPESLAVAEKNLSVAGGYNVRSSAQDALTRFKGKPSKKFVEHLSEGTLTVTNGEVVTVEQPEPATA